MILYLFTRKLSPGDFFQIFTSRYANLSASIVRYVIGYTSRDSHKPLSSFDPKDFYDPKSIQNPKTFFPSLSPLFFFSSASTSQKTSPLFADR